ncbi:MAG: sulfur carrier protein ThiS [Thermomicrobiales bacterium]|nr:sulfur carrier protein ThiS [Thermomicrobiales bacterium]MCO5217276.1 sulfur carrier protein ThiS [Thermomicrobiales bacterium]MCO5225012.1 sulfur carrier protein ThiS [Thermomicrobiales bacterium]MCO5227887.1 sulfur carrier protein ThiS [Thermomicrobiales bacterium]
MSTKGQTVDNDDNDIKHLNDFGSMSCSLFTISTYLAQRKIKPESVAVAVNDEVVPRSLWDEYNLRDEDKIEVVRAVSGGDRTDPLIIAGHTFTSRLFVGTGKYPDTDSMVASLDASGTEMVTVAIRIMNLDGNEPSILESIDLFRHKLLPNTAGAYTADAPSSMARAQSLGTEAGRQAYLAGRMARTEYANPSSPVGGVPLAIE